MDKKKIILLGCKGDTTNIVFNSVNSCFEISFALIEEKENTKVFLKRRIKKLGIIAVFGQIAFQIFIAKLLGAFSKDRQKEIISEFSLNLTEIPQNKIHHVKSINSKKSIELIKELKPDLIIVNGTRIISEKVLSSTDCKFINTHAGITPKYRGVHGTYWALVNNDLENSGVTVHYVDKGIDTGCIISQSQVIPTKSDNFTTYPLLQLAEGLKLLNVAIGDHFENKIIVKNISTSDSFLWYHPTIWRYLFSRIWNNVK